jgi:hydroxymethylglutaryl-CoA reductase (NADPH)
MARSISSSASSGSGSASTSINPLRALAMLAGNKPIEVLVTGFCIVTLAYFQLLHSVKHSEFLQPTYNSWKNGPPPAESEMSDSSSSSASASYHASHEAVTTLVRSDNGDWQESTSNNLQPDTRIVTLARVIVGLDSHLFNAGADDDRNILVYPAHSSAPALMGENNDDDDENLSSRKGSAGKTTESSSVDLEDPEIQASLLQFEQHLKTASYNGHSFQDICYHPSGTSQEKDCFAVSFPIESSSSSSVNKAGTILSLGLDTKTEANSLWQTALSSSSAVTDEKGYTYLPVTASSGSSSSNGRRKHIYHHNQHHDASGLGLSFSAFPHTEGLSSPSSSASASSWNQEENSKSLKWMLYAGRAFIMRFWGLARKADSADIFIMLLGYLLMHLTFINLFINMRKLGSKFWLGECCPSFPLSAQFGCQ